MDSIINANTSKREGHYTDASPSGIVSGLTKNIFSFFGGQVKDFPLFTDHDLVAPRFFASIFRNHLVLVTLNTGE